MKFHTLIASDVDGTLIPEETTVIPEAVFEQVRAAHEKGVLFVAASGRQYYSLRALFEPVVDQMAFLIENGSALFYRDQMIHADTIDRPLAIEIAKAVAKDGEGATKLIIARVYGCQTDECARSLALSVVSSSLVKAAMFGADANWGRVLCALGYAGQDVDVTKIDVSFVSDAGRVEVCKNGAGIPFSEELAKQVLVCDEITIDINMNDGMEYAEAYGCDLTYDYVKINGDYRT